MHGYESRRATISNYSFRASPIIFGKLLTSFKNNIKRERKLLHIRSDNRNLEIVFKYKISAYAVLITITKEVVLTGLSSVNIGILMSKIEDLLLGVSKRMNTMNICSCIAIRIEFLTVSMPS